MRFYQHLNTDGSTLLFIQKDRPEWRSSNPGHNFIEGSPPADIRRTLHTSLNDPTTLWHQPPHNLPPHHDSLKRRQKTRHPRSPHRPHRPRRLVDRILKRREIIRYL